MKKRGRYGTTNVQDLRAIAEFHRFIRNYMKIQRILDKEQDNKQRQHSIQESIFHSANSLCSSQLIAQIIKSVYAGL